MQYRNININKIKKERVTWFGVTYFYKFLPNKIVERIKFFYLRKILKMQRSHDYYINNNQEDLFFKILEDFEDCNLNIDNKKFSKIIFGENVNDCQKIVKQHILYYLLNQSRSQINITRSILLSKAHNKSLTYPIHKKFKIIFEKNNIKINKFGSFFYWYLVAMFFYLLGIKKLFKIFIDSFKTSSSTFKNSIYFDKLPEEAVNLNNNYYNRENYFTFILNYYKEKNLKLEKINHSIFNSQSFKFDNINIGYEKKFNTYLNFLNRIDFIFWAFKAMFLSLIDLFRGRWWHALLLSEAAERYFVSKLSFDNLHDMYFFNQTRGYILRPLWTYEAESKGSEVIFYFYSLNYTPLTKNKRRPVAIKTSSWSKYIVWNNEHEKHLKEFCQIKFDVFYTFPTFFITGMNEFNPPKEKFVTVFDVAPIRTAFQKSILGGTNINKVNNCIKFLKTVIEISSQHNLKVILKVKRFHSVIDSKYLAFLKNEAEKGSLYILDENISSISLIKKSKFIISYPVTTTNTLATFFKIKNCYYSPINEKIDDELLFNSKILYDKKDLERIFKDVF